MTEQPEIAALLTQGPETADLDTVLADLFKCYRPRLYGGLRWRMRQMPQRFGARGGPSDVLQDALPPPRPHVPPSPPQDLVPGVRLLTPARGNPPNNNLT